MKWASSCAAVALLVAGCQNVPATEAIVTVDATSALAARATSIEVQVSGAARREGPYGGTLLQTFGPPATEIAFPRDVALVPRGGDDSRSFQVFVVARAG